MLKSKSVLFTEIGQIIPFSEVIGNKPLRILILGKIHSGKTVAATSIATHFNHVIMYDEQVVSDFIDNHPKELPATCIICDQTLTSKTHSDVMTRLQSRTGDISASHDVTEETPETGMKFQKGDGTLMTSLNITLVVVSEYRNIIEMDWDYILMTHIDIKDNVQLAYGVIGNRCGSLKVFREKVEENTRDLWSLCVYDVKHNRFSSILFPKPC